MCTSYVVCFSKKIIIITTIKINKVINLNKIYI